MAISNLIKLNGTWTHIQSAYEKINGAWIELDSPELPFLGGTIVKKYVDYTKPELASSTLFLLNGLSNCVTANGYTGSILTNSGVTESTDVPNENFNKSFYFNGSSFFTVPNYNFGTGDFTFEWWEKPSSDTAGTRLMTTYGTSGGTECGAMFGWWCTSDLVPEIKWTSNNSYSSWNIIGHGVSAGNVDTTAWHHMAYVRSGSNLYIIKDGALLSTQNVGANALGCNTSLPMCFGRRGSDTANGNCYQGLLCGIRISKTALYTQFGTYEETILPNGKDYSYGGPR